VAEERARRSWYIAIEGAIGVGKTTLARMLREHLGGGLLLEAFEENPFLSDFYKAREQYAFQTQMFFLLSRYRQQRQEVPQILARDSLIADYLFAKDRLFARLNLAGDEWELYQQIQQVLAEQTIPPDLIVYLEADTDVLMARIAHRDRSYERDMDRDYIEALRQSYDRFFGTPQEAPVLVVDTNPLNFVARPADLQYIVDRVRSILHEGTFQQPLPQFEAPAAGAPLPAHGHPLTEYQRFHVRLDRAKAFNPNIYYNYICLSEEMGELGSEMARLWSEENARLDQGQPAAEAHASAITARRKAIEAELADCLAYLLKLANYSGIDLETAYLAKMQQNETRAWPPVRHGSEPG
jgi:deoxyguanosine kinase